MVLDIACFRPTDDPDADGPEKVFDFFYLVFWV